MLLFSTVLFERVSAGLLAQHYWQMLKRKKKGQTSAEQHDHISEEWWGLDRPAERRRESSFESLRPVMVPNFILWFWGRRTQALKLKEVTRGSTLYILSSKDQRWSAVCQIWRKRRPAKSCWTHGSCWWRWFPNLSILSLWSTSCFSSVTAQVKRASD